MTVTIAETCDIALCRALRRAVFVDTQTHALGYYEALGFHAVGDVYDDAGFAHRNMILDL